MQQPCTHLQSVRHIIVHNPLGKALHYSSLADARLANQAWVVLRAP
jgi:hypothetical protein